MSRRVRTSKIEKWIKEGRGSGIGADYKPWLNIQDISSKGRSTRLKGIRTTRQHEFLSDYEQLRTFEKLNRITTSIFGKRIGILANLE